jgi:hypothetical protein
LLTVALEAKDLPALQAGGVDRRSHREAVISLPGSLRPSGGFLLHQAETCLPIEHGPAEQHHHCVTLQSITT